MAVVAATIRADVFAALRTLIIANKPTYTYDDTEYTYTLTASYDPTDPVLPSVVLNKSNISIALINLDGSGEEYEIEVQLDFYALQKHGVEAVETAQDQLGATFIGNISAFNNTDNLLPMTDFWDDSNSTPFEDKSQTLNTASSIVKFTLK